VWGEERRDTSTLVSMLAGPCKGGTAEPPLLMLTTIR
jgi:hypothetical protein